MKLIFIILMSLGTSYMYAEDLCVKAWQNLPSLETNNEDYAHILKLWKEKKEECKKSSFYFLKLGVLLEIELDFVGAEKAFAKGLKNSTGYMFELKLAQADLLFQKSTRGTESLDINLLNKAQKHIELLIKKFPHRPEAYGNLTGILLVKEDYHGVIRNGLMAIKQGGNNFANRNMTVAYYQLGNDEETIRASREALKGKNFMKGDKEFMLATALAFSNLKKFGKSLEALKLLATNNNNARKDPEFQRVLEYIRGSYIQEQNQKENPQI